MASTPKQSTTPSDTSDGRAKPRHPIQVAARRAGISPDALRAWEKRHQAVVPFRAAGGRRLYSDADVERLLLLQRATSNGHRIGQVASLPTDSLQELVQEDEQAWLQAAGSPQIAALETAAAFPEWQHQQLLQACLEAILAFDTERLQHTLWKARRALPLARFMEEVLSPLLTEVGDRWRRGTLRIAHEHLVSGVVRSMLRPEIGGQRRSRRDPGLMVTSPAGQGHELGALMAATVAAADGWRISYLGPDLPVEEIANAAVQMGPKALALSLVYPADDPQLPHDLRQLRSLLPQQTRILVGGRAVGEYREVLDEIGASLIGNLEEMRRRLEEIRNARR